MWKYVKIFWKFSDLFELANTPQRLTGGHHPMKKLKIHTYPPSAYICYIIIIFNPTTRPRVNHPFITWFAFFIGTIEIGCLLPMLFYYYGRFHFSLKGGNFTQAISYPTLRKIIKTRPLKCCMLCVLRSCSNFGWTHIYLQNLPIWTRNNNNWRFLVQ